MAITATADESCQELLGEAEAMAQKFKTAFLKFATCHQVYSSRVPLSDDAIKTLGKGWSAPHILVCITQCYNTLQERIEGFMAYYRLTFPGSIITPKLHMLEDHILPFLREWKVGFGLLAHCRRLSQRM